MPVGPVTHDCVACRAVSYCDCPACLRQLPEGAKCYELVDRDCAIKCPHCGYVEGVVAADERMFAETKRRRRG